MSMEVNFDGLIGPTHTHSGLSVGNLASTKHKDTTSNPKQAALEGLEKMKLLADLGIKQAILPPHERPHLPTLRALGFQGSPAEILKSVAKNRPELIPQISSASSMWAANSATVTPSVDSLDQHLHFTPANLLTTFHRSIETGFTARLLKTIFSSPTYFKHHPPIPYFPDEGAANHMRFYNREDQTGVHLFIYGKYTLKETSVKPQKFFARQSREAQEAIMRHHQIPPERVLFAQQSPQAIDAGVFHNDLITSNHKNFLLYHEHSFVGTAGIIEELKKKVETHCNTRLITLKVPISLEDAAQSFLFNSQIIIHHEHDMALICPNECQAVPTVANWIEQALKDPSNPIEDVKFISLKESLANGGGPACLRLRIILTDLEANEVNPKLWMNDQLYQKLKKWIETHYRESLTPKELADPKLLTESQTALDQLTQLLNLGSLYDFQRP